MKFRMIAAALGSFVLQFLLAALLIVVTGVCLWVIVPVAFPALGFTFTNSIGLSALMYLSRSVFK